MLDNVFSFFEKLLVNFTWTRLTFLVTLILLLLGGAVLFEFYTGHFRLSRVEREVKLLDQMVDLSKKVTQVPLGDPSRSTYDRLAKQISAEVGAPAFQIGSLPELPNRLILGSVPWLVLISLVLLTTKFGRGQALLGMSLVAVPLVAIGVNFPDTWDRTFVYYVYPWGSMIFVVFGILYVQRRRVA